MSTPNWSIECDYMESCNCDFGCTCNFNGIPTGGRLRGFHHGPEQIIELHLEAEYTSATGAVTTLSRSTACDRGWVHIRRFEFPLLRQSVPEVREVLRNFHPDSGYGAAPPTSAGGVSSVAVRIDPAKQPSRFVSSCGWSTHLERRIQSRFSPRHT
jgi:hypothetical protein